MEEGNRRCCTKRLQGERQRRMTRRGGRWGYCIKTWEEGRQRRHLLLQLAVEKEAGVVAMEPWGEVGRRKQQPGYELVVNMKYLAVYRVRSSQ